MSRKRPVLLALFSLFLMAEVAGNLTSFEHTLLESYAHQTRDGARIEAFIGMVKSALPQRSPPRDHHVGQLGGLTGRPSEVVAEEVAAWIVDSAQEHALEDPEDQRRVMRRTIELIKLPLWYRPSDNPAQVLFSRWVPEDLDKRRRDKLATTLKDKLPKLHETRKQGASP